ncbi:MAG TPA: Do family serine endopeptidase [Rhizobiales bacterium]|nr:Do family serine endopeptidase [Hyphomicrobiales bacterium]
MLCLTLLALQPVPARAQRTVPSNRQAIQYSFAPIVKRVTPAVVNVYVRHTQRIFRSPFADDPFFRRFFGRRLGRPSRRMQNSLGSGVIVSRDGIVVTNNHVIKGGGRTEIKVALADKREFDARVVLRDEASDLAILRIKSNQTNFPFLEFEDSDRLEVGDLVLAIGNPFGVGQTVTSGIISAQARSKRSKSGTQIFIQTDAAINPGNSGGALVTMNGRLAGINTAIYSRSGGSNGIGFAIPSNLVRLVVDSALTGRRIERPWLGAKLQSVTRDIAEAVGLQRVAGALVAKVYRGGSAQKAGLKPGDVIVSIDGHPIADARTVQYRLTTRGIGNVAKMGIMRAGRLIVLHLKVSPAPRQSPQDVRDLIGEHPLDGVRVRNLNPALADDLGIRTETGVVVMGVRRGGYGANLGLRRGDVIVSVGRIKITDVRQLARLMKLRPEYWSIVVRRGRQVLSMRVPG